ncbi:apolipoprotein N-acyltransferase [Deinococcus sp. YIM 77859]|uniref:apolipoprotein N-acyltransferase n=1 Tax=Deinococcus sp. YIM 77859 TaxID=1540221 RepID=UPI00054F6863|nr:apolipoprotein N-acyltransferase [Deinococcus sp. YIM 77859]
MPPVPPFLIAALLGLLLAACALPLPWSFLSPLPLALLFAFVARAPTPRQVAGRMWWAAFAYSALHLWWLTAFLAKLFGTPVLGVLAGALYALEGALFAAVAALAARLVRLPTARVWALAGGWVLLEGLRFLGPLAFPWPTLGYSLLPTPAIQIADLGGVLLASVLVTATAASFVSVRWGSPWPHRLVTFAWLAALAYGITRVPGQGPEQPLLVLRTDFDAFGRATRQLSEEEQLAVQRALSAVRSPAEPVVWSETAMTASRLPQVLPQFPGPGVSGLRTLQPNQNVAVAVDAAGRVLGSNVKARLVPFGEYFPLYAALRPAYGLIEQAVGFQLGSLTPAHDLRPLALNGVSYGTYICYDSVFPWVARTLVRGGAQLLVNPSNDGWYDGWGVQQHFLMGRVRAIETRRWVVRSVNRGIAGAVDDLGRPRRLLTAGEGALHVRPRLLSGQTVYTRVGDLPALLLAALMVGYGVRLDRRDRERGRGSLFPGP